MLLAHALARVHTCVYTHAHTYARHAHMHSGTYTYTHRHIDTRMHTHIHKHMHMLMCTHTRTHIWYLKHSDYYSDNKQIRHVECRMKVVALGLGR